MQESNPITMRSINELNSRLAFIFAASLNDIRRLEWMPTNKPHEYSLAITSLPGDRLVITRYSGSALVNVDNEPFFALDGYHKEIPLSPGDHKIVADFYPYKAFGEHVNIDPGIPFLVNVDEDARQLWLYGVTLIELINGTTDEYVKQRILDALTRALSISKFEGISRDQLMLASDMLASFPHHLVDFIDGYDLQVTINHDKYVSALAVLKMELEALRNELGKRGSLIGVGHAHIDAAWLWPFEETARKVARTFSTVVTLMRKHDFHYIQSSALYYEWIRNNYPSLFNEIKRLVAEGKWELGAGWVEFDANISSGESIARQLLYSQRYFLETFGKMAEVLWLPDTFGFSAQLPQLIRLSGIKLFATHKVFWNDTNKFPYSIFEWVGIDGSSVAAVAFGNGAGGYNSTFSAGEVLQQWSNWKDKDKPMLYSFGYGDGGGGPTEEMLIKAKAIDDAPLMPKVSLGGVNEMIRYAKPMNKWVGELYLETHRGVYTSHSRMKYLNRRAENAMREMEIWSTMVGNYDRDEARELWRVIMKNQFHDVLPGSAINDVYREVYPEMENVINKGMSLASSAIKRIAGKGNKCMVFNSLSWDRVDYVTVQEEYPHSQAVSNGYLIKVSAPSVGYSECIPLKPIHPVSIIEGDNYIILDNGLISLKLNKDGSITSLIDKENNMEALRGRSNVIIAYENIPGWADAWDIEKSYSYTSTEIHGKNYVITEKGPLRACIDFDMDFSQSSLKQSICMYADSRRVDFKTNMKLIDRELLLKAWFNVNANTDNAVFEIPYGVIRRSTTLNTSWNQAMFEVPMQKWVDVSDDGYGVALLNDGKYGVSVNHSMIGLSLGKSPLYPDPLTDMESNTFTYSIYPHAEDWFRAKVFRAAYELNSPPIIAKGLGGQVSLIGVAPDNLVLEAMKMAEDGDGIVLRLFNIRNNRGRGWVRLWFKPSAAYATDILEMNKIDKYVDLNGDKVLFDYGNHEIITLIIKGRSST
jgi:alpha-mannosidase